MAKPALWIALAACLPALSLASEAWLGSWAEAPVGQPTMTHLGAFTIPPAVKLKGTLRYRIRLSQGGKQLRVRITNEYSDQPLVVGAVSVGVAAEGLSAAPGSLKSLTFGGQRGIRIPAGAPALSDPVALSVGPLADLVLSIWVPEGAPINSCPPGMPVKGQESLFVVDTTLTE